MNDDDFLDEGAMRGDALDRFAAHGANELIPRRQVIAAGKVSTTFIDRCGGSA